MTNPSTSWHGVPREKIDWHPTVDPAKCTGCGACVVTCSEKRNVFGYDRVKRKAFVLYPDNCMVGCNNCQVGCLWDAISFPGKGAARALANALPGERLKRELEDKLRNDPALVAVAAASAGVETSQSRAAVTLPKGIP